jgi:hypothetical protein
MDEKGKALAGVVTAAIACAGWQLYPNHEAFKLKLQKLTSLTEEPEKSPLAFLEHYHYGLTSLIIGRLLKQYSAFLDGFGLVMILSELTHAKPFGIGKTPTETIGNLGLSGVLTSLLLMTF